MDWITFIAELVIPVLGTVLTVFIVPLLKEKRYQQLAQAAVEAAEQVLGKGEGERKYDYAHDMLKAAGVTDGDAKRLIEAAVYQLNRVSKAVSAGE